MNGREFNMKDQLPGQMTMDDVMIIGKDFAEDVKETIKSLTMAINGRLQSRLAYPMPFTNLVHIRDQMERLMNENQENMAKFRKQMEGLTKPEWHFLNYRPATEEEKEAFDMQDCPDAQMLENAPEDGEEVIIWTGWGTMSIDTFHWDMDGCYFDGLGDMDGVIAWMPTPKPPKEGEA